MLGEQVNTVRMNKTHSEVPGDPEDEQHIALTSENWARGWDAERKWAPSAGCRGL